MCDDLAHGGRRCPSCAARRARERARYAAKKAAKGETVRPYNTTKPPLDPGTDLTSYIEGVRGRAEAACASGDPAALAAAEVEIRAVGETLEARAEEIAGTSVQRIHDDMQAARRDLVAVMDDPTGHGVIPGLANTRRDAITRPLIDRDLATTEEFEAAYEAGGDEAVADLINSRLGPDPTMPPAMQRLVEARRQALAEVRPLGGDLVARDDSAPAAVRAVTQASAYYPTAWIQRSNELDPPRLKATRGRAHYTSAAGQYRIVPDTYTTKRPIGTPPPQSSMRADYTPIGDPELGFQTYEVTQYRVRIIHPEQKIPRGWHTYDDPDPRPGLKIIRKVSTRREHTGVVAELTVPTSKTDRPVEVAAHELAHRMEHADPRIAHLEQAHLDARRGNAPLEPVSPVPGEVGWSDGFGAGYTGRRYHPIRYQAPDGTPYTVAHREVLSTGMQATFFGALRYGVRKDGTPDRALTSHALGLLATL